MAIPPCIDEQEEKSRTLTFCNWPKGTESSTIKDFIGKVLKDHVGDLDDDNGIFTFGRETARRGAARFKTVALMLKYMRRPEMCWKLMVDDLTIYINRDVHKPQETINKDRAMRKLIRAIIEEVTAGTQGEVTRKLIETKYGRGLLIYKGVKVGAYADGKLELLGDGAKLRKRFDDLMNE